MDRRKESKKEAEFSLWIQGLGFEALKLRIEGDDGFPDRTVLLSGGRSWFVEWKRGPSDKLRPRQRFWKRRLESLGHFVLVTHSLAEAKASFLEFLNNDKD